MKLLLQGHTDIAFRAVFSHNVRLDREVMILGEGYRLHLKAKTVGVWNPSQRGIVHSASPVCSTSTEDAMYAFDPAVMHEMAILIAAITCLLKAIWPNGIRP